MCIPNEESRPWGHFITLFAQEPGYKIKRIEVLPGKRLSLQCHHRRSEHWVVVSGAGVVEVDQIKKEVRCGQYIFIETRCKHRIECTSLRPLVFIEIQIGDYLGEDDIERFEDLYGRV